MKGKSINRLSKQSYRYPKFHHSKEIKTRRYKEGFFDYNISEMYSKLHFISARLKFDIKELVELLLENLYNETKFDEFVYQIGRFEDEEESPSIDLAILTPIFKQYMKKKEFPEDLNQDVLLLLNRLISIEMEVRVFNRTTWKTRCFYISKGIEAKFYRKSVMTARVKTVFQNLNYSPGLNNPDFAEFLKHMKETLFLSDRGTDKEIEKILSRYYLPYSKKMQPWGKK